MKSSNQAIKKIPNYPLRTTHYALRLTFYASRVTHHVSRITHHVSRITFYVLICSFAHLLICSSLWADIFITLQDETVVSVGTRLPRPYITLSDVAKIKYEDAEVLQKLGSIKIGAAPIPGQSRFLSVDLLKMYLRNKCDLKRVTFLGAKRVKVFPETIKVSKELILEQVKYHIKQNFTDQIEVSVELEGHFREFEVYKGELEFEVSVSRKLASVKVMRSGVLQRALYLPIKVIATGDFTVATKPILAKAVLETDDVTLRKMTVESSLADIPVSNLVSLVGMRAKVRIPSGQVIRASMVEETPLVERGDRVTILLQTPPLLISTLGRAEGEGTEGQIIKVVNLSSRKMIHAEIIGEKLVKVAKEEVRR